MQKPYIVVLTGAGISAESGIATFRASDGLWEHHRVDDVATPQGYRRNARLVQEFYNARRQQLTCGCVEPNAAHMALAQLEAALPDNFLLVTQNIDNLHERAGSENLIHMHGELLKVRCEGSGRVYAWERDVLPDDLCTCCAVPQALRPHIVWFGEVPFQMDRIYEALQHVDYFISIGTSGNVYPAAGFVQEANLAGAKTIELNLEPSQGENWFQEKVYGPATQTVPQFVTQLLEALK